MATKFKNEYFKDGEILFGVFYPTRYIIAVFETAQQAEAAVADLNQRGFEARYATPEQVLQRANEFRQERSLAQKVAASVYSDEQQAIIDLISMARQGRHFVDVYVPDQSQVRQAEACLDAHHAEVMIYYGEWDLINLSIEESPRMDESPR
jgi:pantoate kinase